MKSLPKTIEVSLGLYTPRPSKRNEYDASRRVLKALRLMNDSGRHWIKGHLERVLQDGSKAYCMVGGLDAALGTGGYGSENSLEAMTILAVANHMYRGRRWDSIPSFNDVPARRWEHIVNVMEGAATMLREHRVTYTGGMWSNR